jgi:hypothetical protein
MITLDRLFHIDLTHVWNRPASLYQPLAQGAFDKLFSEHQNLFDQSIEKLIQPRCLFPKDLAYVAELARRHQACSLTLTLVTHREDAMGEPILGQGRQSLPMNEASLAQIRSMLPSRLMCGLPLLAEVEICLDGALVD